MHHLYRFAEPVILFLLKRKGHSYGYDLAAELKRHALTDATIENATLYRTLRHLEENGYVVSDWEVQPAGPARRIYSLTAEGERHLEHWTGLLGMLSESLSRFVSKVQSAMCQEAEAQAASQSAPHPNEYRHETVTK
jgi:DNA-binding PadR family transcriptional regulator